MSIKGLFADFRDFLTLRDEPEVQDFVKDIDWFVSQRNIAPENIPGTKHLTGIETGASGHQKQLALSLQKETDSLAWLRPSSPEITGEEFYENCGFVELMGERGHFDSSERAGGLFFMGPNQFYPSHYHAAEELYIPLTGGALWMRDGGPFVEQPSGAVIVHESNETHGMRTGDTPLLALWMWRDGDLTQKPEY